MCVWIKDGDSGYSIFVLEIQVTVFKQRASRLAALNERLIGIKVGDFWSVLKFSDLSCSYCFFSNKI